MLASAGCGWVCQFHEGDVVKTPISRRFIFQDSQKIREIATRGHGISQTETGETLNQAISAGCGGIWLTLNDEQYAALTARSM